MTNNEESMVKLLVTYSLKSANNPIVLDTTVDVPATLQAEEIVPAVKQRIRPHRSPDPSDNYRGQNPSDVVVMNLVNLEALL